MPGVGAPEQRRGQVVAQVERGADLRRELENDASGLEARARQLAARKPMPAPERVFAELIGGLSAPKPRKRKSAELVKDGKKVLFRFTTKQPGHYDIRLGKALDAEAYRELHHDLKHCVQNWLKQRSAG